MKIILILTLLLPFSKLAAENPKKGPRRTQATWVTTAAGTPALNISLSKLLNEKQLELINSGFSTFSQLIVYGNHPKNRGDAPIFELSCTVKFDLWEELYELARLDKVNPKAFTIKSFDRYSQLCLSANLEDPALLAKWKNGVKLTAALHIDQISAAKASEIKEWLVRQQSGVMRGIFSHMLGNLKLSESLEVTVEVPPTK